MKFLVKILLFSFLIFSCTEVEIVNPLFEDGSILDGTGSVPEYLQKSIEGVYSVQSDTKIFGSNLVAKFNGDTFSFYGERLGAYFITKPGIKTDSTIVVEGKWKFSQSSETGLVRMTGVKKETGFIFSGKYSFEDNNLTFNIELKFLRNFSRNVLSKDFYIVAHRGGGRNSDYLGVSENTVEITSLAGQLGANGIEIDVKLSKDNIPFLYHDISINLRTTKDSPIWGPIEDFTFAQIRSFVKLINGEKIPSLEETLNHVLFNTDLKLVWLDMKSEKNSMPYVIPIVRDIEAKALGMDRELQIYIGLPDEFMRDNYMSYKQKDNVKALCELTLDDVRKVNAAIWAPRWTLGLQNDAVNQIHNEGRKAITWTLDESGFIETFIRDGKFDGILTNYPTLVAYYYYVQN